MSEFMGFPKEMTRFFEELKSHNTREWFTAHKKDYEDLVQDPAREFVIAMGQILKLVCPGINAIPKINQSLFRVNRDFFQSPG